MLLTKTKGGLVLGWRKRHLWEFYYHLRTDGTSFNNVFCGVVIIFMQSRSGNGRKVKRNNVISLMINKIIRYLMLALLSSSSVHLGIIKCLTFNANIGD